MYGWQLRRFSDAVATSAREPLSVMHRTWVGLQLKSSVKRQRHLGLAILVGLSGQHSPRTRHIEKRKPAFGIS